jgi:FkbM family methyltransferase
MNQPPARKLRSLAAGLARRLGLARYQVRDAVVGKPSHYEIDGIRLPADERLISENIDRALRRGRYEQEERNNLPGLLRQDDVVLELGGGLGLVSTLCARNPKVRQVTTVEANPELIPYIHEVHRINGVADRTQVINGIAIPAPSVDAMDFFLRNDFWASSTNGEVWGWREKTRVPVKDLNALVAKLSPKVLIVDIEGGEGDLFDGFLPGSIRHIYLELHGRVIRRNGIKKIFDDLSGVNFVYDPRFSAHSVVTFSHLGKAGRRKK